MPPHQPQNFRQHIAESNDWMETIMHTNIYRLGKAHYVWMQRKSMTTVQPQPRIFWSQIFPLWYASYVDIPDYYNANYSLYIKQISSVRDETYSAP